HRAFVLQAQIDMAESRALHAVKLAAQPHEAEPILDRALEQVRNLGDRKRLGVVPPARARYEPAVTAIIVEIWSGHEHPSAGLGRARTCAGVEAGAIPPAVASRG